MTYSSEGGKPKAGELSVQSAMILAAGRGERMRPLTDTTPKPMVPVAGKALIDWPLDILADAGVDHVVINSSYLAEMLEGYLAQRAHPKVQVSREAVRLETGGGIAKALPLLGTQPFFSMNSDAIVLGGSVPALERLNAAWDAERYDALLLLIPTQDAVGYEGEGDFFAQEDGQLRRRLDAPSAPYVFTGMQILHPRFFAGVSEEEKDENGAFSLNVLYNRNLQEDGCLGARIGYAIHDGGWYHVGDVPSVEKVSQILTPSNSAAEIKKKTFACL